uniref:Uncharacterized protein n=1 Tax=Oryza meridionalis TaxID=40149 RepID=A0A0E0CZF1_9ORYZ
MAARRHGRRDHAAAVDSAGSVGADVDLADSKPWPTFAPPPPSARMLADILFTATAASSPCMALRARRHPLGLADGRHRQCQALLRRPLLLSLLVFVSERHRRQRGPPPPSLGGCAGDRWSHLPSSRMENKTRRGEGEGEAVADGATAASVSTSAPLPAARVADRRPSRQPSSQPLSSLASRRLSMAAPATGGGISADVHILHSENSNIKSIYYRILLP